jgi:hypothetical protein
MRISLFLICVVLIQCLGCGDTSLLEHPVYPVMGIVGSDPRIENPSDITLDGPEAFAQCSHYQLLYSGRTNVLDIIKDGVNQYGLDTKVITYTGGFTVQRNDVALVDREYRNAVAMYPAATLAGALDEAGTSVQLNMGEDLEWPFHASTADISDGNNEKVFCFWIRINDEYMKVSDVDQKAKTLVVERGFESTKSAAHSTGTTVLVPMYLGGRETIGKAARHANAWPHGPDDGLRYALDPAAEGTARFKARFINEMMALGYHGAWWDTFEPRLFNLCDPLGRRRSMYWNFQTGSLYNRESFTEAMKKQIRNAREIVRNQAGREPVISANNLSTKYEAGSVLIRTPEEPNLLDGYCFEDAFIRPRWTQKTAGEWDFTFEAIDQKRWETQIRDLRTCAERGLQAYAMIGPAGYVMKYFHPGQPNRDNLERYAWASFLLTVTKERTTFFGMPLSVTQVGNAYGINPLKPYYFYPIGDPLENLELNQYRIDNQPVWMRRFENGIAIVSRSEQTEVIELPADYRNPETGKMVTSVRLGAWDGIVLTK